MNRAQRDTARWVEKITFHYVWSDVTSLENANHLASEICFSLPNWRQLHHCEDLVRQRQSFINYYP